MVLPILTAALLLTYDTFIFDLDGVLKTDVVIPNAPEIVNFLYEQKKEVLFVSNNDWETAEQRTASFHKMGFIDAQADDFINPSLVAADYFKRKKYLNKTIYLLAPPAAVQTFVNDLKCKVIVEKPNIIEVYNFKKLRDSIKKRPDAVIMDSFNGYTNENLAKSINYLRDPTVDFYTLSGDDRFKGGFDLLLPDVGAFKLVVELVSGRKATPLGKPSAALNDYLLRVRHLNEKKAIMFGDNLNTDITMANELGIDSCLMLTGVHHLADVTAAKDANRHSAIPTFTGNFTIFAQQLKLI